MPANALKASPHATAWKNHVRKQLSDRFPDQCPFAFKFDPFTAVAFAAFTAWENGQLQIAWGTDPPAVLLEAVELVSRALSDSRAWQDEQREAKRKAANPP